MQRMILLLILFLKIHSNFRVVLTMSTRMSSLFLSYSLSYFFLKNFYFNFLVDLGIENIWKLMNAQMEKRNMRNWLLFLGILVLKVLKY